MSSPPPSPRRPRLGTTIIAAVAGMLVLVGGFLVFQRVIQPDEPASFYDPPATLPDGPPGTIIRDESVESDDPAMRVGRLLYTSTGADGSPIAVSGVIAAPTGSPPSGGWPVNAWAHGTTGIASRCAPSIDDDGGLSRIPEIDALVAAGNVVVATDYVGLGTPGPHPYLVGESEGRAVLDSVRAARSFLDGDTSADTVIYGHSQGGHATVFAAQIAPEYAPELHVLGAAPMAPPTDLGELMHLDIGEPPGLLLTALAVSSWSRLYPQADEAAVTHPEARPFVAQIGEQCVLATTEGDLAEAPDILALAVSFLSTNPADAPGWSELLSTNSPAAAPLHVPLLVTQGLADTMVRPPVTTAYVEEQCTAGASIQLDTYAGVGHFQLRTVAAPDVVAWLQARLAGTPPTQGCTTNAK